MPVRVRPVLPKIMIRLVLIIPKLKKYAVYEGKQRIAFWKLDDEDNELLSAKEVENLRTDKYEQA
jgi:hypothetical protein